LDACNSPLLLGAAEINGSERESILKIVPEIMDGKGMVRFMRDSRLLRTARRSRRNSGTPLSTRDIAQRKANRARRFWDRILENLETAEKILPDIQSVTDLNRYLNLLMKASSDLRIAIKVRKAQVDKSVA
jgi:hypothetical protein